MAAPALPSNLNIQQGNGQVLLTWDLVAGAVSYAILRSIDQINYTQIATTTSTQYLDESVSVQVQYYYEVASIGTASAFAEATLTFSGQPLAAETVTIANTIFTAVASGATGTQFNIGSTVAETITNLVAKINSNLTNIVIATATSTTLLTIQAFVIGPAGNGIQFSEALTNVVGTAFSGGSAGQQSSATAPVSIVPSLTAQMSLSQIRLLAQQRADRVNSNFVTLPEWNVYINQSAYELYDLLVTVYEDYYLAPALEITTDGLSGSVALPDGSNYDGVLALYKLMGVDYGIAGQGNGFIPLRKFNFIDRNNYPYPQLTTPFNGVYYPMYRQMGDSILFTPQPSAGQRIKIWYVPKLRQLLLDTDVLDGISGWTEYIVVDAAIKALTKEESDTSSLMNEKMALIARINSSASNRDAGMPDTVSNTRYATSNYPWGYGGGGWEF